MMTCEQIPPYVADYLTGKLPPSVQPAFAAHLGTCLQCREQVLAAQEIWQRLETLPVPEPSPELRARFYDRLAAETAGVPRIRFRDWLNQWVPLRLAFQWAGALALGIAGWIGGAHFGVSKAADTPVQVTELRKEVDQMRQLVALSLLQQQSATERMRGVTWSYRVGSNDSDVVQALLKTVDHDENVNVRLAAVDALQKFARTEAVRRSLVQSLLKQDSPLVQIAIIDLLAQVQDRNAVSSLEKLAQDATANPAVRQRATWGVRQIE